MHVWHLAEEQLLPKLEHARSRQLSVNVWNYQHVHLWQHSHMCVCDTCVHVSVDRACGSVKFYVFWGLGQDRELHVSWLPA